jgi:Tol biopolymer transport system component
VMTGPGAKGNLGSSVNKTKSKVYKIDAGGKTFQILSLSAEGKHPEPKADGDKIVVGGQTISFDGKQIMFSKMQGSTPVK